MVKKLIIKELYRLIKNRKASPLVEEGMLLGLAAITFTVILSIVSNIITSVQNSSSSMSLSLNSGFTNFLNQLAEILNQIARALGIK